MARKKATAAPAPAKRVGLTSAVYDGTGLRPRGNGAGRLTSAPAKPKPDTVPLTEAVDTTDAVSSTANEAADTKPGEGTDNG